jgi:hypothetical protein
MTKVLLVLVCLFGALVVVLLGALVELYKQVQQIRAQLDMDGAAASTPIDLKERQGVPPSSVGLPRALDDAGGAIVLFLSDRCITCRAIANVMQASVPQGVWVVAEPVSGIDEDAEEFVREFGLGGDRTLVDRQSAIAEQLDLDVTPAAIYIENGRLERAETVPSSQRYTSILSSWKQPLPLTTRP